MIHLDEPTKGQDLVPPAEQMRKIDAYTIENLKTPGIVLMHEAGKRAAEIIIERYPPDKFPQATIICGGGNNGGDGYIVAKYLYHNGYDVKVFLLKPINKITGDAKIALSMIQSLPITIIKPSPTKNPNAPIKKQLSAIKNQLESASIVVDAILGTGFNGSLSPELSQLVKIINKNYCPIISLDIPSGMAADHPHCDEVIHTSLTVTFGFAKPSLVIYPSAQWVGDLYVVAIGFTDKSREKIKINTQLNLPNTLPIKQLIRDKNSHKGHYGHVLVLGGSKGMVGAPILAGHSALISGSGLVTVAVPELCSQYLPQYPSDLMIYGVPGPNAYFGPKHADHVINLIQERRIDVIVMGMGMGRHPDTLPFLEKIIKSTSIPIVIDADGLGILKKYPQIAKGKDIVATPHPREFVTNFPLPLNKTKTTLDINTDKTDINAETLDINADPIATLIKASQHYQTQIIYKTARSLLVTPKGKVFIHIGDNPGMATAGMGDVLAGIVGSLIGQNLSSQDASRLGLFIHSKAGELASKKLGFHGLTSSELIKYVPLAMKIILNSAIVRP